MSPYLGVVVAATVTLSLLGCRDSSAPPVPSLEEMEPTPGQGAGAVACGEDIDNPDFSIDFSLTLNGCPAEIPSNPTYWQYEYRPAVARAGMNVYATYAIYYDRFGNVWAEQVALSPLYQGTFPRPLTSSGQFPLSYPADVTGIKFRSYASLGTDCSGMTPEACWQRAKALGYSSGYHDEVRYCVVDSTARDLESFCNPDGIDFDAPALVRETLNRPPTARITQATYVDRLECDELVCVLLRDWTLDASASTDPEGGPLTYYWDVVGVTLETQSSVAQLTGGQGWWVCVPGAPSCWQVRLTVTDDHGQTNSTGQ